MLTLKSDRMVKSKNIASLLPPVGHYHYTTIQLDVFRYKESSALAFDAIHFISKVKGFVNAHDEWQNLLHYEVKA